MTDPVTATRPRVTVGILSHRNELLPRAIASVMAQTYTGGIQMLVNYSPLYWGEKLNDMMRVAQGEFIVILCDDDELAPTFLERTVAAADTDVRSEIVYTDTLVKEQMTIKLRMPTFDAEVLKMYCVPWMTALVRRSLWESLGGFDPAMTYGDWDFWLRACRAQARAIHLRDEFLYVFNDHTGCGSRVMNHDEPLRQLRQKHSYLPDPNALLGSRT